MVEKREIDESQLLDQTLRLFQNAVAEAETLVPPAQFSRAAERKDLPLSKPSDKQAGSLISEFVAFARTVAGFENTASHTSASSRAPAPKSAGIEPVENVRSDPSVDRMLSAAPIVQLDEPYVVGAAQPPSFVMNEAKASPGQTLGKSASRDRLHLEGPIQERPHAPIDHGHSPRVAKNAAEKPVVDERSDLRVDRVRSTHATVAINESNVVGAVPPTSLSMAETTAASLRQSVDKRISRNELSLESPTQEKTATPIELDHPQSVARNAMERPVVDERFDAQVDQPPSMVAVVPIDESKVPPSLATADIGAVTKPGSVARPPGQPTREGSPVAIKNAHSLVVNKDVVSAQKRVLIRQLLISEPTMAQIARPSLQPCPKRGPEKPIVNAPSSSLADQAKWMIADDKPDVVGAVFPFSANNAGAVGPLRKPVDEPSPPDMLPSAHPVQGDLRAPFDNALTLVNRVVSELNTVLVKRVSISQFGGAEAMLHSFQSPGDKPALRTPTGAQQSEVDHAPCLTTTAAIGEADVIEAESPPNMGRTEPLLQEISLIDRALSLVKGVVISERNTVFVKKVAISEFNEVNSATPLQSPVDKPALEKPDEAPQSEALVDHGPSMIVVVPNSETNVIEAASRPSLNTAGTEPLSRQRPIDRSASKEMLRSLGRQVQEEPPSIDRAYPAVVEGAPTELTTENAVSLVEQPLLRQLSPEHRLDEELADIRRRVAAFKEHQQRFRREREAGTMTSALGSRVDASGRLPG